MDEYPIKKLEWDSRFFGYPVGMIDLTGTNSIDTDLFRQSVRSSGFKLVYIFSNPLAENANSAIGKAGAVLVDRKIIFSKETENHQHFTTPVIAYTSKEMTDELIRLALSSGLFSRFRIDAGFTNNEFERLYTEWIEKSISEEIAQKIFVTYHNSKITGLITLGKKDNMANVGLLSVDEKYKGRKIGYDLVRRADAEAYALGFKTLTVATQNRNQAACSLYQKCNFIIAEEINVYHFWNN